MKARSCSHTSDMVEYEPGRFACTEADCDGEGEPQLRDNKVIGENGKHNAAKCGCDVCWRKRNYP